MRSLVLIAIVAAALGAPAALAAGAAPAGALPPTQYTDPTGDAGPGPDITNVTVSNDAAGNVTFRIDIPNRPTLTANLIVVVWVDADVNTGTGDPDLGGIDYSLTFLGGSLIASHWNGSIWEFGVTLPSFTQGAYASGVTMTINVADLGGVTTFAFWVSATDNLDDDTNFDAAPLIGLYTYILAVEPSISGVVAPGGLLASVKPGKTFSVKGFKLKLDNGQTVKPDSITCTLKIAGKLVKPLPGGCKWKIPATAAGKRLTLTVTLTLEGDKVSKTYSGKVAKK